ncbi:MAG: trimethylamine methyltransferase family protein, partial [Candidatus Adiutrix sp.]
NLPCRSGGGLSDSLLTDGNAGAESALALANAINSGVNFVLHAAGILGGYISISFEKFLLDEEIGAMVSRMIRPFEVSDETIDLPAIKRIGPGGHFLTESKTFKLCRQEIYQTKLMNRLNIEQWQKNGGLDLEKVASLKVKERLNAYVPPDMPPSLKKDLVKKAKQLAGGNPLKMGVLA